MEKDTTTYVALDDSKRKLVVAILRPGEREPEQREMPKEPQLIQRVFQRLTREGAVAACYEAGVSGYDLYRQITACGVACQVIAPALTPRRPGQRIKTDRRDAAKLVRLFRAGELTAIHVPDEAEEAVRDLLALPGGRPAGCPAVAPSAPEVPRPARAPLCHGQELESAPLDLDPCPTLRPATAAADLRGDTVRARAGAHPPGRTGQGDRGARPAAAVREPVGWLRCFRGIDTLSAMILLAEIVDFQRFRRPRELMAYLGLVPSEYSSGETLRRGAITKAGNTHVGGCSWKPPGTIATAPRSAGCWRPGRRDNPPPSSPMPGARNSVCIVAIAISLAMANVHPSP